MPAGSVRGPHAPDCPPGSVPATRPGGTTPSPTRRPPAGATVNQATGVLACCSIRDFASRHRAGTAEITSDKDGILPFLKEELVMGRTGSQPRSDAHAAIPGNLSLSSPRAAELESATPSPA